MKDIQGLYNFSWGKNSDNIEIKRDGWFFYAHFKNNGVYQLIYNNGDIIFAPIDTPTEKSLVMIFKWDYHLNKFKNGKYFSGRPRSLEKIFTDIENGKIKTSPVSVSRI